jgi:hypothetical protein
VERNALEQLCHPSFLEYLNVNNKLTDISNNVIFSTLYIVISELLHIHDIYFILFYSKIFDYLNVNNKLNNKLKEIK